MRLIALLCWYQESPTWLAATVASLAKAEVDHLVAVDGCYALWPNANQRPVSGPEQMETIIETARGLGIGTTVYTPSKPFLGNEVEKRNLSIQLAMLEGELHEDWMMIIDSDEVIDWVAHDFKQQLRDTDLNVASYHLFDTEDPHVSEARTAAGLNFDLGSIGENSISAIQRLLPGLRLEETHYKFCHGYGAEKSYLWGRRPGQQQEEALRLDDLMRVEHRHHLRGLDRKNAAKQYYDLRDRLGAEQEHDDDDLRSMTDEERIRRGYLSEAGMRAKMRAIQPASPVIADAQSRDIPARTITVYE